jgi:hypothetical protein
MLTMVHCKRPRKTPANADIPEVIHNPAEDTPAPADNVPRLLHATSKLAINISESLSGIGFQKYDEILKYTSKVILS